MQDILSVKHVMSSEGSGGNLALSTSGSDFSDEKKNCETSSDESS